MSTIGSLRRRTKLKPKWDVHFALTFAATCPIHTWDMEAFLCGLLVSQCSFHLGFGLGLCNQGGRRAGEDVALAYPIAGRRRSVAAGGRGIHFVVDS